MKKSPIDVVIKLSIFLIGIFIFLTSLSFTIIKISKNSDSQLENNEINADLSINSVDAPVIEAKNTEDKKISLVAIGDIMCHNSQFKDAYKEGTYDFSYVFTDIKTYIENADIAIGNLETTFAGSKKGYSGYPQFNTPETLAYNLKDIGIDVLTTTNNHCLDSGYNGIESTIDFLDQAEIAHTGTFKSPEDQNTILFKEVNGIKIAFLAYTYGTNGIPIPKGKEYCVNLINKEFILSQLDLAKKGNPDIICVSMHWGVEYQRHPNDEQLDLTDFLFNNGVDIILGSHPHVLQPFEKREITLEDGTKKDGFVIYSLGNFMAAQNKENTRNSIILNLSITKHVDTNKITIDDISYVPIYMYSYPTYNNYKILDINNTLSQYNNGETPLPNNPSLILKNELQSITQLLNQ